MSISFKTVLVTSILTFFALPIFSRGSKNVETQAAHNLQNWQNTFDLEDKKPGKYNFFITAKDIAGNERIEGPYNIYVDPRSDLPKVSIINPKPNMIVRGNLNIVGTALDDDKVSYVELVLDNDEEHPLKATGTDFWSYYLDTNKLEEGKHLVKATSIDINGLRGNSVTTEWNLDRKAPITELNYSMGSLVRDKITFTGSAKDGNGIKEILYSIDDANTFTPLKFKNNLQSEFKLTIDTKLFKDGPKVIWFKAKDKAGSTCLYSFLFFIDNSLPELRVISPNEESQFGNFSVCGYSYDTIGLKSFKYYWNGQEYNLPIVPGNPYWIIDLDSKDMKDSKASLTISVEDLVGNVTSLTKNISLNQSLDKPTIELISPIDSYNKNLKTTLRGRAIDSDGIESVRFSLDGGDFITQKSSAFVHTFKNELKVGPHSITVIAKDRTGVESDPVVRNFTIYDNKPVFSDSKITGPKKSLPYTEGYVVNTLEDSFFITQISSEVGLKNIHTDLICGDTTITKDYDFKGEKSYNLKLPFNSNPMLGIVRYNIKGTDTLNQTQEYNVFFKITRPDPVKGKKLPQEEIILDNKEMIYILPRGNTQYNRRNSSYITDKNTGIVFYSNTDKIIKKQVITSSMNERNLSLEQQDNAIILKPSRDGIYENLTIITKDIKGKEYRSSPITLYVDSSSPELSIATPNKGEWVKKTFKLSGTVADNTGIKFAQYSMDNGKTWSKLKLEGNELGATFSLQLDVTPQKDGIIPIDVMAVDSYNHENRISTLIYKDSTPPKITILTPEKGVKVNGKTLLSFLVQDNVSLDKALYVEPQGTNKKNKHPLSLNKIIRDYVGTDSHPLDETMSFEVQDQARNVATYESWKFFIDSESDKPKASITLPLNNEVITSDLTISGILTDDDGPCNAYYKIDDGKFVKCATSSSSFTIDIPFSKLTDNEHTVYVYAEDINGTEGKIVSKTFRVSKEEPKGTITSPTISSNVKGIVNFKGTASDKNGINRVLISLDNGNTYNKCTGKDNWSYSFDSTILPDDTHVVFIKIYDNYEIESIYSSIINVDNTEPELHLDLPLDNQKLKDTLSFSGYGFDNKALTELYASIKSLEGKSVGKYEKIPLPMDRLINKTIKLDLEKGLYNVEVRAIDKAHNEKVVSRNINVDKSRASCEVDLLYPLSGESKNGLFNIYGRINTDNLVDKIRLYIDNNIVTETYLTDSGYFSFEMGPEFVSKGLHTYFAEAVLKDKSVVRSLTRDIDYNPEGPWIIVENFKFGDFAFERPFITGHAGYSLNKEDVIKAQLKDTDEEFKLLMKEKSLSRVDISFDNGKTFKNISHTGKWMTRIENEDLSDGNHYILLRAIMRNGETCIERLTVQIDNTKPEIRVLNPIMGSRYNQSLGFDGLTSDNVGLKDVNLTLRKGDKAFYEVPSFIQGLYLDWSFWGATLYNVGVGLTFFDDNVKLQMQWGQFTQAQRNFFEKSDMRYGGDNVIGIKILANVASIPFSYFMGRDYDWLSCNVAVGASFTRFNETASGEAQILSALLGQIEFPKISNKKAKMFSAFSLYTEFSLWFIPTDVEQGENESIKNLIPQISEGIRINVF